MERILVIEDDESLAMGIEYALQKEKYNVILAQDRKAGEEAFEASEVDLVLLDVMLPDGSGFDLCQKIREKSEVPIIFLTACDEEVNVVRGLDMGGDDYITKPFRVGELVSRIRAALRRKPGRMDRKGKRMVKSGAVVVDFLERKLYKNDREIFLTPMEYKLVEVFIQNELQVIQREQILDKLWDVEGAFIDDNTLSVHIRRLREKIEDDPSSPGYIVTVRGFGYKWNKKAIGWDKR